MYCLLHGGASHNGQCVSRDGEVRDCCVPKMPKMPDGDESPPKEEEGEEKQMMVNDFPTMGRPILSEGGGAKPYHNNRGQGRRRRRRRRRRREVPEAPDPEDVIGIFFYERD